MKVFPRDLRARVAARLLAWLLIVVWLGASLGCATSPRPSRSVLATPRASAVQDGPAEFPASIATETTVIEIPFTPAASPNSASAAAPAPDAGSSVTRVTPQKESGSGQLAAPKTASGAIVITTTRDHVTAARTYPPPSPPSVAELALADGLRWFLAASLVCLLLAGLLVWRGHVIAAICFGLGGVALPVLARFFSSDAAMTVTGILAGAGVAFFAAWHLLKRPAGGESSPPS